MKFAAIIEYLQDSAKVESIRPVHRQYLSQMKEQGRLAISGPFADGSGALIVYEAQSREEAEAFLQGDPFCKNGIFLRWQIRPWNPVIAKRELLPT